VTTPPPTCTASEKPAPLTTAKASAERAPLLQCSTTFLSCGSLPSASPDRNSPFGIRTAPGIATISNSFGSRTSTSTKSSPDPFSRASIIALRSRTEIVELRAASAASLLIVPQNAS